MVGLTIGKCLFPKRTSLTSVAYAQPSLRCVQEQEFLSLKSFQEGHTSLLTNFMDCMSSSSSPWLNGTIQGSKGAFLYELKWESTCFQACQFSFLIRLFGGRCIWSSVCKIPGSESKIYLSLRALLLGWYYGSTTTRILPGATHQTLWQWLTQEISQTYILLKVITLGAGLLWWPKPVTSLRSKNMSEEYLST